MNTARAYVNGSPVTFTQFLGSGIGGTFSSGFNNFLGQRQIGDSFYKGLIDEASIYSTELSASQIQSIFNAGTAGKCKPTATLAPSGQVAWFAGDGDARDFAGTNDGTLNVGAGFAIGKVGQSFSFDGNDDSV